VTSKLYKFFKLQSLLATAAVHRCTIWWRTAKRFKVKGYL